MYNVYIYIYIYIQREREREREREMLLPSHFRQLSHYRQVKANKSPPRRHYRNIRTRDTSISTSTAMFCQSEHNTPPPGLLHVS